MRSLLSSLTAFKHIPANELLSTQDMETLGINACGGIELYINDQGELCIELQPEFLELYRQHEENERKAQAQQQRLHLLNQNGGENRHLA